MILIQKIKKLLKTRKEFWGWFLFTILGLLIIHCLFKIHPQCDFFCAEWSAGELITFLGTIILGYVAYTQTKRASHMAEMSDRINQEFLRIQEREYVPVIRCVKDEFCGVTMFQSFEKFNELSETKLCVTVMKKDTIESDPYLGYSLAITNNIEDIKCDRINNRMYELHLKYVGKYGIKNVTIKDLKFYDNETLIKEWKLNQSLNTSFDSEIVIPIHIFIFDSIESDLINKIKFSNKMELSLIMQCYDGTSYFEKMSLTKHYFEEEIHSLGKSDVELLVSASYDVKSNIL